MEYETLGRIFSIFFLFILFLLWGFGQVLVCIRGKKCSSFFNINLLFFILSFSYLLKIISFFILISQLYFWIVDIILIFVGTFNFIKFLNYYQFPTILIHLFRRKKH